MTKIFHQKSGASDAIATTTKTAVHADLAVATVTALAHATEPSEAVSSDYSASAHGYMAAAQSDATTRAYATDMRHFLAHGGSVPASPALVVEYLSRFAGKLSVATLERRLIAIHRAHRDISLQSPTTNTVVKRTMQGIRRTYGVRQRQVLPMVRDLLLETLVLIDLQKPMKAARDRAALLVGFSGAFRRAELVAIRVEHITYVDNGVEIYLPVSKTDQEQSGRTVFIPHANGSRCPVRALMQWLDVSGIREGFVFRSVSRHDGIGQTGLTAQSIALLVKSSVARSGGDAKNVAGHSLRSGYCTTAAMAGHAAWQIREVTGHRSDVTLAKYIRPVARRSIKSLL